MPLFLFKHRIKLTVLLSLAFAFVVPVVPALRATLPWSFVALAVVFAGLALAVRERFDAGLAFLLAASFTVARFLFPFPDGATLTLRTASLLSYALLHGVLLIGPWSRFVPAVRGWVKHRRHLGVTTFFLALLHTQLVLELYFGRDIVLAWQASFTFFGSTALLVMAVLAATSWDWWQKHVPWKWWAIVHAAILAIYLVELVIVLGVWKNAGGAPPWVAPAFMATIAFWILIAPWGLAPRLFKIVNGWKQLHVLVYVAYASLVLHVYFGVAQAQGAWARVATLVLLALVVVSHGAGWIRNRQERRRAAVPEPSMEPWHDVAAVTELKEGEGRRVDIHGIPVAIFLHDGNVLAFFGYCAHQKGPLWQGRIVQGYLTCPWHGWQYSTKDGKPPPGFHDGVPFYETKIENGRVLVNVPKNAKCPDYGCRACRCRG